MSCPKRPGGRHRPRPIALADVEIYRDLGIVRGKEILVDASCRDCGAPLTVRLCSGGIMGDYAQVYEGHVNDSFSRDDFF